MKKNNGFTLVELLAVITILGIIMVIGGIAATKIKRDANIKEAEQLQEMIKDLAPSVYVDKKAAGDSPFDTYDAQELYDGGYLKSNTIKNPSGGADCKVELEIKPGPDFSVNLCCPGLYKTGVADHTSGC